MRTRLLLSVAGAILLGTNALAVPRGELLASTCMSCHGPGGKSRGEIPNLAGLDKAHFIKSMQDFKSGARASSVMKRHASGYTEAEYEQMAEYFSRIGK